MTGELCPMCGQEKPEASRPLTQRELEVLMSWWTTGSVKKAAHEVGVGEQRAKNLLARARIRSGCRTNGQLLAAHMDEVRSLINERITHNLFRSEPA